MLLRVASRRCAAAAARRRPLSVAAAGDDGALMDALRRCDDIYRRDVAPVNEALHGPLEHAYQPTVLPFVLLLGNHSSGKSSFANFALGRDVQTAGVAPTDDSFTVIAPGASDADQDGPALVGDPDLGFEGLRKFGPGLIQRTQLKIRSGISPKNFMLVDSPGMIDSPGGRDDASSKLDRGYHFENAVKWFADRADVVLLFFDPDKPGTTGETLAILTNALAGQDHKLHIILNKADKFERIHDFARAYGALCWNLSKVIPRKDLPRIYTMCIPQGDAGAGGGALAAGLADLRKTRDDVLAEVGRVGAGFFAGAPALLAGLRRRAGGGTLRLADDVFAFGGGFAGLVIERLAVSLGVYGADAVLVVEASRFEERAAPDSGAVTIRTDAVRCAVGGAPPVVLCLRDSSAAAVKEQRGDAPVWAALAAALGVAEGQPTRDAVRDWCFAVCDRAALLH